MAARRGGMFIFSKLTQNLEVRTFVRIQRVIWDHWLAFKGEISQKQDLFLRCLEARQPGKVSNGLNAQQSEIFTEFPLKDSFKLFDDISCFLKNVERFQKLCSF